MNEIDEYLKSYRRYLSNRLTNFEQVKIDLTNSTEKVRENLYYHFMEMEIEKLEQISIDLFGKNGYSFKDYEVYSQCEEVGIFEFLSDVVQLTEEENIRKDVIQLAKAYLKSFPSCDESFLTEKQRTCFGYDTKIIASNIGYSR